MVVAVVSTLATFVRHDTFGVLSDSVLVLLRQVLPHFHGCLQETLMSFEGPRGWSSELLNRTSLMVPQKKGTTLFRLSELIDPFFRIQYCECLFHQAMHFANDTMIGSAVLVASPRWFPGLLGICRQRSDRLNFLLDPRRHHPSPLHQIVILNQMIWACGPPSSRAPQSIAECRVRCLCQNHAHKR